MRRALAIASLCVSLLLTCAGVSAQNDVAPTPEASAAIVTPILTVDIDRLYSQSQFGLRITQEYEEGRAALATENRRIAEALREEELALAAARPEMDPTVFQTEAEAFDEKAQGIRRAQDAKERALEALLSGGRDQFLEVIGPILEQVVVERGASAVLDRRAVLVARDVIDITDEATARIDAQIGDGTIPDD